MSKRDYGLSENMRLTKQRRVILDILRGTDAHPTADWLYAKARRQIKNLSLGTVYRNLGILSKEGVIQKLDLGMGQAHYDGRIENHIHLICDRCGSIKEIMQSQDFPQTKEIEQKLGYKIDKVVMEMHGFCPKCKLSETITKVVL